MTRDLGQGVEDTMYFLGSHFCKGNLSVAVESHTVLAEGKSEEKSLRIPQPQGEDSIYYGNPLSHGNTPCLPDINPDFLMGDQRRWGLDEGEVVIARGRIFRMVC